MCYERQRAEAGLLDLPAVGLQKLSKLRVCARVQYVEARRKLRLKCKNLQGKEAAPLDFDFVALLAL